MPFRIVKYARFMCDQCGKQEEIEFIVRVNEARKKGWAISKDYKKCYCPKCAPQRRNVGMAWNGVRSWVR